MEIAAFTHAFVQYEEFHPMPDAQSIEQLLKPLPNSAWVGLLALGVVTSITAIPTAAYATLPEDWGATTEDVQAALIDLGYYEGEVDGAYGADTEAAIIAFQQDEDLFIDGVSGEDTLTRLGLLEPTQPTAEEQADDEPVEPNQGSLVDDREPFPDYGSTIANVQVALADLGFYAGEIDGVLGAETEAAVIAFQQANGLTVDGVIGTETLTALGLGNIEGAVPPLISDRPVPRPIAPSEPDVTPTPSPSVIPESNPNSGATTPAPQPEPTFPAVANEEEFELGRIATIAVDAAKIYSEPNDTSDSKLAPDKGAFIAYTKRVQFETGEQWYFLPAYDGWISGDALTLIDS